jgi:hypothetical protein
MNSGLQAVVRSIPRPISADNFMETDILTVAVQNPGMEKNMGLLWRLQNHFHFPVSSKGVSMLANWSLDKAEQWAAIAESKPYAHKVLQYLNLSHYLEDENPSQERKELPQRLLERVSKFATIQLHPILIHEIESLCLEASDWGRIDICGLIKRQAEATVTEEGARCFVHHFPSTAILALMDVKQMTMNAALALFDELYLYSNSKKDLHVCSQDIYSSPTDEDDDFSDFWRRRGQWRGRWRGRWQGRQIWRDFRDFESIYQSKIVLNKIVAKLMPPPEKAEDFLLSGAESLLQAALKLEYGQNSEGGKEIPFY